MLTLISTKVQLTTQDTITPYKPPNTPANPYRTGGGNILQVKVKKESSAVTVALCALPLCSFSAQNHKTMAPQNFANSYKSGQVLIGTGLVPGPTGVLFFFFKLTLSNELCFWYKINYR